MNWRSLPLVSVGCAAVLIGGLVVMVVPEHAVNVLKLVILTVVVAAAMASMTATVPEWSGAAWWVSPFDRRESPADEPPRASDVVRIREALEGRRHPIDDGVYLPPDALRLLRPLVRTALEREGVDPDRKADLTLAAKTLAPATLAVVASPAPRWLPWYRTRRAAPRHVAVVVNRVLDDLEHGVPGLRHSQIHRTHEHETP